VNVIEDDERVLRQRRDESPVDRFLQRERIRVLHRLDHGACIEERSSTPIVQRTEDGRSANSRETSELDESGCGSGSTQGIERPALGGRQGVRRHCIYSGNGVWQTRVI
jgi:hypothetical protein